MVSHPIPVKRTIHAGSFRHAPPGSTSSGAEQEEDHRPRIQLDVDSSAQPSTFVSLIRQIMASFGFELAPPDDDTPVAALLRLTIATGSRPSPPPSTARLAQDQHGALYTTSDGWEWHGPSYHLEAQPADPSIHAVLHAPALSESDHRLALAYAARHAVTSMLPHTGWIPLHGAALEAPRGQGILMVGPSGSGKSTLSAGLVLRGWACVSDDLLLLSSSASGRPTENNSDSSRSGAVRVEGLTTDLRLCPDARDRLHDDLAQRATPIDSAMSTPYGADNKSGYVVSAHPATYPMLVVIPSITDDLVSRLEPISSPAGLRAVLEQMPPIPSLPPVIARRVLRTAGDLVRPCSCVRLHAGRDLYDDPGRLADLLAPHLT